MGLPILAVQDARLPKSYEKAKAAISECYQIDECKDWADKAEALASYARQSKDDTLLKTAMRIQGRAVRRAGELLREIEKGAGRPRINYTGGDTISTRSKAASDAGLSKRQKDQALRVANVPEGRFEEEVESDTPPTVSQLAEMGTVKQKATLERIAKESSKPGYKEATYAIGAMKDFVGKHCRQKAALVAGGIGKHETAKVLSYIRAMRHWLKEIEDLMEG